MQDTNDRCGTSNTASSPTPDASSSSIPTAFERITAAIKSTERKLIGAARLLSLFDKIADAAEFFGANAFSFTVFSEHVDLAFETAKMWATSRHLAVEEHEITLTNGAVTKVLRVVDSAARDLFRVSFSTHGDRARELRARNAK